jgi:hypothetical protein
MSDTSASTNGWGWRHGRYGSEGAADAAGADRSRASLARGPIKRLDSISVLDPCSASRSTSRATNSTFYGAGKSSFGETGHDSRRVLDVVVRRPGRFDQVIREQPDVAASASTIGLPAIWRCDVADVYHPLMSSVTNWHPPLPTWTAVDTPCMRRVALLGHLVRLRAAR